LNANQHTIFGGENSFAQSSNKLPKGKYNLYEIEDWFHNKQKGSIK
jgi:hypothetical protein